MAASVLCFITSLNYKSVASTKLIIFFLSLVSSLSEQAQVARPRGVALSKKAFYDPDKNFNCFDGSNIVPFSYVNDDYCDCLDGSDEPGTSACPNGMFHCTNAGHRPLNIPSSRVNDGICDCCDSSDEYNSSVKCISNCKELGRQAREEAERHLALLNEGFQKKLQMVTLGKEKRQMKKDELSKLQKEVEEIENQSKELEEVKKAAEELEKVAVENHKKLWEEELERRNQAKELEKAMSVFSEFDVDTNYKLSSNEILTRSEFDSDGDGVVSEEELQNILKGQKEIDLSFFTQNVWNLIRDKILPKPDPIPVPKAPDFETPPSTLSPHEMDDLDKIEEDGDLEEGYDEKADSTDEPQTKENTEEKMPEYDEATKKLVADAETARSEFKTMDDKLRDLRRNVLNLETFQSTDFGPDDEFAPLEDRCIEYNDRQYIYRLCMFDTVTQKPQSGGSEVNLGSWGEWTGSSDSKYSEMKYSGGTGCWNGPARSTNVKIRCGLENQILSVSEPNRCVYLIEMETPAMCQHPESVKPPRDEL